MASEAWLPCPNGLTLDCPVREVAARELAEAVARAEKAEAALREAIGWSYGEEVTPERRDEVERMVFGEAPDGR